MKQFLNKAKATLIEMSPGLIKIAIFIILLKIFPGLNQLFHDVLMLIAKLSYGSGGGD